MIILNKNSLQDYFSLLCKSLSHRQKLSIYYAIIAKNYKTGDFESLLFGISAITYGSPVLGLTTPRAGSKVVKW